MPEYQRRENSLYLIEFPKGYLPTSLKIYYFSACRRIWICQSICNMSILLNFDALRAIYNLLLYWNNTVTVSSILTFAFKVEPMRVEYIKTLGQSFLFTFSQKLGNNHHPLGGITFYRIAFSVPCLILFFMTLKGLNIALKLLALVCFIHTECLNDFWSQCWVHYIAHKVIGASIIWT